MRNHKPFLFILVLFVLPGYGQDTLSLSRAIQFGLENNFDIQLQDLGYQVAKNNAELAARARYPTINLSINQNNSIVQRKPANPFAVAGRNISDNVNGQLDFQFILFDGFALRIAQQQMAELERLTGGYVSLVIENTIQGIILAYYTVLLDRERLNVLHRVMDFSHQQYDYVKLRKELGSAITFDVLNEQNNYLTDSANYLRQEAVVKSSMRNLNLLINVPLDETNDLTDALLIEEESYAYEDLYNRMVRSNTNLANQYVNMELSRLATQSARSDLSPTITLNVGANGSLDQLNANFRSTTGRQVQSTVGYVNNDPGLPVYNTVNETMTSVQTQKGHLYGAYGNFGLRWTLFNAGQVKTAIQNAQIEENMARIDTEQLKLQLQNELMLVFDQYNLRRQLVNLARIKLDAAELNLDLANERYKNGSISALDLRIIQQNYRTAALENFSAIYDAIDSRTNIVRLTGGFVEEN